MSRLIAIGDIHGQYTKLRNLLDKLDLGKGDEVFLLGDYVDSGAQSADVIEYLIDMRKFRTVWPIMGNHDAWFLDYLESGYPDPLWFQQGGKETLDSYGPSWSVPESHVRFLKGLWPPISVKTVLEDVEYIFSHGFLAPTKPIESRFNKEDALWGRPSSFQMGNKKWAWKDNQVLIFGHTPHELPTWYSKRALCIDTGAKFEDNPLTAVILPKTKWATPKFLQSEPEEAQVDD